MYDKTGHMLRQIGSRLVTASLQAKVRLWNPDYILQREGMGWLLFLFCDDGFFAEPQCENLKLTPRDSARRLERQIRRQARRSRPASGMGMVAFATAWSEWL